jgi:hypothetical protein
MLLLVINYISNEQKMKKALTLRSIVVILSFEYHMHNILIVSHIGSMVKEKRSKKLSKSKSILSIIY